MEYRIEQLARQAGVPVDTIRFYQGRRLIDPPRREGRVTWYGEEHLARLRRIRELQQRGFSLRVIRRFLDGELAGPDESLVEAVTRGAAPTTLSQAELAAAAGIAVPVLQQLAEAGLLAAAGRGPDGEPRYPAQDGDALSAGHRVVEAGIPLDALITLGAAHARGVEETARAAVELFDEHVRRPLLALGDAGAEGELLARFDDLLDASAVLVAHHFRRTLLRVAQERIESR